MSRPKRRKVDLTVFLEQRHFDAVEALARARGVSRAVIYREAVDAVLAAHGEPAPDEAPTDADITRAARVIERALGARGFRQAEVAFGALSGTWRWTVDYGPHAGSLLDALTSLPVL